MLRGFVWITKSEAEEWKDGGEDADPEEQQAYSSSRLSARSSGHLKTAVLIAHVRRCSRKRG